MPSPLGTNPGARNFTFPESFICACTKGRIPAINLLDSDQRRAEFSFLEVMEALVLLSLPVTLVVCLRRR